MRNLDEAIAYEIVFNSYMAMLRSASREHLFNNPKSNIEIDSDHESVHEAVLKYKSSKPLNNHINSGNKANNDNNKKKIKRGGKKARKERKKLFE